MLGMPYSAPGPLLCRHLCMVRARGASSAAGHCRCRHFQVGGFRFCCLFSCELHGTQACCPWAVTRPGRHGGRGCMGVAHLTPGSIFRCALTPSSSPPLICLPACSFGVLLWEIITGLRPARGQLREVVAPEECPQAVKELLDSCLSSDPAQRPTAAQIIEVLTRGLGRGNSSQTDLAAAGVVPPPAVPADPSSGINSTTLLLPKGGGSSGQDGVLGKGGLQQDVLAYAGSASTGSGLIPAESADGSGRPASEWIELGPATPPPPGQQPAGEQQPVPPPAQEGQQPQGQQPLQEQAEQAGSGETFDEAHARLLAAAWQAAQQAFGGESDHPC